MAKVEFEDLLQSDALVQKDRRYPSPSDLRGWFLYKLFDTGNFDGTSVRAEAADQLQITSNDTVENSNALVTYRKGLMQIDAFNHLDRSGDIPASKYTTGIIWAYGNRTAQIKVYTGANIMACMNMMVLNADAINTFKLTLPSGNGQSRRAQLEWEHSVEMLKLDLDDFAKSINKNLPHDITKIQQYQDMLFNERIEDKDVPKLIGDLTMANIELDLVNSYTFNFGIRAMLDSSQPHDIYRLYNLKEDGNNRMWNVYNAFTQHLNTHKVEIDTKPEKVLGVTTLLEVVNGTITAEDARRLRK